MRRLGTFIVAAMLVAWFCGRRRPAVSLWDPNAGSMFADNKARRVGDLVTLIIVERSEASQAARTTTSKDAEVSIGPGLGL